MLPSHSPLQAQFVSRSRKSVNPMVNPARSRPKPLLEINDTTFVQIGGARYSLADYSELRKDQRDKLPQDLAAYFCDLGHRRRVYKHVAEVMVCGRILQPPSQPPYGPPICRDLKPACYCREKNACPICRRLISSKRARARLKAIPFLVGQTACKAVIRFRETRDLADALRATQYLKDRFLPALSKTIAKFQEKRGKSKCFSERLVGMHFHQALGRPHVQPHLHLLAAMPDHNHAEPFLDSIRELLSRSNCSDFQGTRSPQFDTLQAENNRMISSIPLDRRLSSVSINQDHFKNLIGYVTNLAEQDDEERPQQVYERIWLLRKSEFGCTYRAKRLACRKCYLPHVVSTEDPLTVLSLDGSVLQAPPDKLNAVWFHLLRQAGAFIKHRAAGKQGTSYAPPFPPLDQLTNPEGKHYQWIF